MRIRYQRISAITSTGDEEDDRDDRDDHPGELGLVVDEFVERIELAVVAEAADRDALAVLAGPTLNAGGGTTLSASPVGVGLRGRRTFRR